jgi:ESF2/ABP1 family protein
VLQKRIEKKREKGEEMELKPFKERPHKRKAEKEDTAEEEGAKKKKTDDGRLDNVLSSIF